MVAAYPLFYQVGTTESGLTQDELNIVLEAFTVTSTAYTSKLILRFMVSHLMVKTLFWMLMVKQLLNWYWMNQIWL